MLGLVGMLYVDQTPLSEGLKSLVRVTLLVAPGLIVGLKGFQNDASLGMGFMLTQPFLRETTEAGSPIAPAKKAKVAS